MREARVIPDLCIWIESFDCLKLSEACGSHMIKDLERNVTATVILCSLQQV